MNARGRRFAESVQVTIVHALPVDSHRLSTGPLQPQREEREQTGNVQAGCGWYLNAEHDPGENGEAVVWLVQHLLLVEEGLGILHKGTIQPQFISFSQQWEVWHRVPVSLSVWVRGRGRGGAQWWVTVMGSARTT